MKYNRMIIPLLFVLLCLACVGFLYQSIQYKNIASNETSLRQRAEWTLYDGIRNVGESIYLDSVVINRHLILRYDSSTCLICIAKAEKLLYEVFGKEYLTKELCYIGAAGNVKPYKDILAINRNGRITPMDDVYTPYFCVINDYGDVLFTLPLIPDNYDYNRDILIKLRKALTES